MAGNEAVEGVEVLALEEHVDYWDYIGWKDPFSSPLFSRRQADYQPAFGRSRNYTPQMVIDGRSELPGGEEQQARATIAAAARQQKGSLSLERKGDKLFIKASGLPPRDEPAEVILAIVESGLVSKVERGENEGRTLLHAPVARSLRSVGAVTAAAKDASLSAELLPLKANQRVLVFIQGTRTRRVMAASIL